MVLMGGVVILMYIGVTGHWSRDFMLASEGLLLLVGAYMVGYSVGRKA